MKTLKTVLIALVVIVGTHEATAAADPLMQQAQKLFRPIPEAPPAVKGVPATPAMIIDCSGNVQWPKKIDSSPI
jgi:hypothetical protein